ncbi:MAG: pilus assembly protein [Frankiales bacterium]|nr:pilus assembly protein [Frankiales bacterium]
MRRPTGDDGNALVEFSYLAVLLMVPLVYVLLTVFQVQRAAFGVTEAARQAGRAYVTAADGAQGAARARAAAELALRDQGLELCPTCLAPPAGELVPGGTVSVRVEHRVVLPLVGGLFRGAVPPSIPVRATHVEVVDRFRPAP